MSKSGRLTAMGALASFLAILPLLPLTDTDSWLIPASIAIALVVLTGAALRRWRAPRGVVPLVQFGVAILWLGILVAADVAWMAIVPTPSWFGRLSDVIGEGVDTMVQYAAPVPVERGVMFFLVGGAALVAIMVETAVFALRRVPLAGIPLGLMYAVGAVTAREGWAWVWFVPPAVGFMSLLVSEGRNRVASWGRSASPSARHTGLPQTDSLARSGRRAGVVAVAIAVAVPAWLPALTEGVIGGVGGGSGGGGRTIRTDNPIVDLRRDLVREDNIEIFRYTTTADQPEYIRTATLDVFDGEQWRQSERPVPESQHVADGLPWPPGLPTSADVTAVEYEFDMTEDFSSRLLPLAYPTRSIDVEGDWRYDSATLDVVAARDDMDIRGQSYRATSLAIDLDNTELRDAAPVIEEMQELVQLPEGMRDQLGEFIDEAIGDITNPHEQAAALQAWFRSLGDFSYSLEREPGTSASLLLDFLQNRVGYCEQFAATMAIMARAVGIPARVAVGYTPGEEQDDGSRIVRSHDSHAWPELFFDGVGWVRFEPTPSTRTNAAPAWTLPVRENDGGSQTPDGAEASPGATGNDRGPANAGDLAQDDLGALGGGTGQPSRWPVVLLVATVLLVLVLVPHTSAVIIRSSRWRRAEGDPVAEAEAAWTDFRDAVRDAGLRWDAAATPRGMRRRLESQLYVDDTTSALVWQLVQAIEQARYAAHTDAVPGLREDARALRRQLLSTGTRGRRIKAWLWPAAFRDVTAAGAAATAEGLTWLDSAGERLRNRLAPVGRR
ncbi:MAG TPA: DUF3488 and transglutaminase-like domain-containing protein [Jiangellales bacterium]|nr:DUF3488 and transglutaminase-like domain-containing protein [Jiangellales bacterium]